uniref:Uncharacterized protein n=2 Tax=gambiae species complex TaxID=44542 RepID=A0A453YZ56_ANOGA
MFGTGPAILLSTKAQPAVKRQRRSKWSAPGPLHQVENRRTHQPIMDSYKLGGLFPVSCSPVRPLRPTQLTYGITIAASVMV